jgi:hypothetical protein
MYAVLPFIMYKFRDSISLNNFQARQYHVGLFMYTTS